jgi:3-isopropylmalate dehydrogenase
MDLPVHGSAPDIAGQNVEAAIEAVLQSGKVTADLRPSGAPATTEQVGESVCAAIG